MRAVLTAPTRMPLIAVAAAAAATFFALLVGALVARSPALGAAAGAAALLGPVALLDLPVALAAFTATLFVRLAPGVGIASNLIALLVLVAWGGNAAGRNPAIREALARMRPVIIALIGLLLWLTLTLVWATETAMVLEDLPYWILNPMLLVVVATTATEERSLRMVVARS